MSKLQQFKEIIERCPEIKKMIPGAEISITLSGFDNTEIKELAEKNNVKLFQPSSLEPCQWFMVRPEKGVAVVVKSKPLKEVINYIE